MLKKNQPFSLLVCTLFTLATWNIAATVKAETTNPEITPISTLDVEETPELETKENEFLPLVQEIKLEPYLAQTSPTPNESTPVELPSDPTLQLPPLETTPQTPIESPETPPNQQPTPPQVTPTEQAPTAPETPPETPPATGTPSLTNPQTPATTETPTDEEEPRVLISEVVVSGANPELEDLIYNTIRTRPGRSATRSQLQEDVNVIYATGFFAKVDVAPEDTPLGVRVTFLVQANPVLNEVTIDTVPDLQGKQVLPDTVVREIFQDQYGKILNLKDVQEGVRQINQWYSKNGYDLAQVVGAPQIAEDGTLTLVIAEGYIENIQVRFFTKEEEPVDGRTRDFIITREMELKPGDVFNRNTAQRDLQRVFGLGIFEDVRLSFDQGSEPGQVIVNVDTVEGRTGSIAAGAGYSSNSGLFGSLSYQQQNLGGNNQTLGTELQIGQRELLFDVSFTDPWIATDPYRTSYTVNAFRRRSISLVYDGDDSSIRTDNGNDSPRIVRTGGGITFVRPLAKNVFTKPDWTLSAGLLYQHVEVRNADGDIAPRARPEDNSIRLAYNDSGIDDIVLLTFGATRDFRDNPSQPTSGSLLRVGAEQSLGISSIFYNRIRGSYSYYLPVRLLTFDFMKGPQTLAFNVQAGTVIGGFPPYEAFVLGGSNSVRGYAEGEVGSGSSYAQFTAEYRFPIISIVGGALFFDAATNLGTGNSVRGNPSGIRDLPGSGFGYGAGIRVQSPVGSIRVDYGFNNEGDSRVHFAIGERF
nr:BamA/TamA family outer membrane protein [Aphanothece hegewaldii]